MIQLLRFDLLQLFRERLALQIFFVGLIIVTIAVSTGASLRSKLKKEHLTIQSSAESYKRQQKELWRNAPQLELKDAIILPTQLVTTVQVPLPVLVDFAVGWSLIEPSSTDITLRTRPDNLFTRYQIENPERLSRGALDLTFVIVVVAPLLLIVLGYGIFCRDRDSGVAKILLSQAGTPLKLITARSINRVLIVFIPIVSGALFLWLSDPNERGISVFNWLFVSFLSLLFWWSIILTVNTLRLSADTALVLLIGIWVVFVILAPSIIFAANSLVNSSESKFSTIALARAAEIKATRTHEDEHPELSRLTLEGRQSLVQKGIEIRSAIAQALESVEEQEQKRVKQQLVFENSLAYISPPMLVYNHLVSIASSDKQYYRAQQIALKNYAISLNSALSKLSLGQKVVDELAFNTLPSFTPSPKPLQPLLPLLWLVVITIFLCSIALIRFKNIKPL